MVDPLFGGRLFEAAPTEPVTGEVLVRLRDGFDAAAIASKRGGMRMARTGAQRQTFAARVDSRAEMEALAADPAVDYVEPNRIRSATGMAKPADPRYAQQWSLDRIEAAAAWQLIPGGFFDAAARNGRVKVAILDSGADCRHPDFINAGGTSADAADGGQIRFALSKAFVPTNASTAKCAWNDDNGHGTHVAAIAAGAANNGAGVAGIGYPVELLIYRVLDGAGNGDDLTISNAILKATDAGARIISMSLGWTGYSQTLQNAINYAWERGVLVVAAAGNLGSSEPFYPAAANHVLSVSATEADDTPWQYSNYGTFVDVAAPGAKILSASPAGRWEMRSGTSMATPLVAGLAGLVATGTPGLAADAIARRIEQSSVSEADAWSSRLGHGRINARRAVAGELNARESGNVTGQVVDANGLPVAGIPVAVAGRSTVTGPDGLFRFQNVPAGAEKLVVDGREWAVTVIGGATATVTPMVGVTLVTVSGTIESAGLPVAGAAVEAVAGGRVRAMGFTAPDGTFSLRTRAFAETTIRVSEPGFATASVEAGQNVRVELGRLGEIRGAVRNAAGEAVAGVAVRAVAAETSAGAVTDEDGSFTIPGLPSSEFIVTAALEGETISAEAAIENGGVVTLTLQPNVPAEEAPAFILTATASPLAVEWSTPEGRPETDRIALFRGDEPVTEFHAGGQAAGSASLDLELTPGKYEFRYIAEDGTVLGVSNALTVADPRQSPFSFAATVEGGELQVSWKVPEGGAKNDWVGVFLTGSDSYSAIWWTWTDGAAEGMRSIKLPASGTYEIRYFPRGDFEPIAQSETFELQ